MNKFGSYLKDLRKRNSLTTRRLADLTNVSASYISNVENGKRGIPSAEVLERLAEVLQADYVEFLKAAGHTAIPIPFGDTLNKGNLLFKVPYEENVFNPEDRVMTTRALTEAEIMKRFFDLDRLLNAEKTLNYKGITFTDKQRQLLKTFLDALLSNLNPNENSANWQNAKIE
ncbi:helix-turn-helix domain-containing protein [Bacillus dakarensis]|uniref:helix-turn-helix domain-containing protein n=1 Tax=Robertmurraya dakarensis TaxID=1926278 RepID=UPI000981FB9D|nr:transcriptional regulator [Bacillus dakarensis]